MEQSQRRTDRANGLLFGRRITGLAFVVAAIVFAGGGLVSFGLHEGQESQSGPPTAACSLQDVPAPHCQASTEIQRSQAPRAANEATRAAGQSVAPLDMRGRSPRRAWQQQEQVSPLQPGWTLVEICANAPGLAYAPCEVMASRDLSALRLEGGDEDEQQGREISGHVLSAEGDALAGVAIVALPDRLDEDMQASEDLRFWTTSDSLGAYFFSGLPAGEYTIRSARHGEYRPARVSARTGIDYADLVMARNVDLVVEGRVVGEFGEPIEGVTVFPVLLGQPSVQTGMDGRFELPLSVKPAVASLTVRFQMPGYRDESTTVRVAAHTAPAPVELMITMDSVESWTSVEGVVTDDTGRPLAGRRVELRSQTGPQSQVTTTDRSGRYAFAYVASPADYRLLVAGGDGYRDVEERLRVTPTMSDVVVVAGAYRVGSVTGQLVNQGGAPIADFDLVLRSADAQERNTIVSTDSLGNFEVPAAPAGELVISSLSTPTVLVKGLHLEPGERISLPLVLDWGDHSIRGIVVDSKGNPVPASRVILNWSRQDERVNTQATRRTATDSLGQFAFSNLGPGPHSLKVDAPGYLGVDIKHDLIHQGYDLTVRLN